MFCLWARVDVETSLGGGDCGMWGESVLKPSTVIVLSNHHQPASTGPGQSLVSQTISIASVETVESLETGAG